MYGGFEVYKVYLSVKNHFTTKSYDYAKYGGKVTVKLETFTKRHDRYFFHKLSKRYNEREILDYFVSNFIVDSNKWIGNLLNNDGHDNYISWKKYKDSIQYSFRSDCVLINDDLISRNLRFDDGFNVSNGQHPRVLRLYLQKKISIQSLYQIDKVIGFSKRWSKQIEENVVWPKINDKLTKMAPFVNYNMTQAKLVMKEIYNGS